MAVDNSDVKGTYYDDPGSFEDDSTIFDDLGQKDYAHQLQSGVPHRGTSTVQMISIDCSPVALYTAPFSVLHVHARANSLYQFCPFRAASLLPSCSRSPSLLAISPPCMPWSLFHTSIDLLYDVGLLQRDPTRAATEDTGLAWHSAFPPTAGPDGICTENNYGHFMEPVRDKTGVRVPKTSG